MRSGKGASGASGPTMLGRLEREVGAMAAMDLPSWVGIVDGLGRWVVVVLRRGDERCCVS